MQDRLLLLRQLRAQRITRFWLATSGIVLLGLALAGGAMRLAQASGGNLFAPDVFYEVMRVHGSGMVAVGLMASAALLWHLVSDEIEISVTVNRIVYVLTLAGLLAIVVAVIGFGYSSAWTFLYPLPQHPGTGVATTSTRAAGSLIRLALAVVRRSSNAGSSRAGPLGSPLRRAPGRHPSGTGRRRTAGVHRPTSGRRRA